MVCHALHSFTRWRGWGSPDRRTNLPRRDEARSARISLAVARAVTIGVSLNVDELYDASSRCNGQILPRVVGIAAFQRKSLTHRTHGCRPDLPDAAA